MPQTKEEKAVYDKKKYQKNKKKYLAHNKKYYETPAGYEYHTITRWEKNGLIYPDIRFLYMIYEWWNTCDECGKEKISSNNKHMEHNHMTGEFRGVVCASCNHRIHHEDRFKQALFNRFKFAVRISRRINHSS